MEYQSQTKKKPLSVSQDATIAKLHAECELQLEEEELVS